MKNWNLIGNSGKELSDLFNVEVYESDCETITPLPDIFDFGLFFNSTEERTLEYNKIFSSKSIKKSLLVDFKNKQSALKSTNLNSNNVYLKNLSLKLVNLSLEDIFNYEDNLDIIIQNFSEEVFKLKAKCFIDVTGVPLIYTVTLLRFLKLAFPSPDLYLFNVSANYKAPKEKEIPQFSDGYRENIYIPGYYGKPDFSKPWLYIFLLGFEGYRSLNIYKVNEPDFVEAIIGDPGYQDDYFDKAVKENKAFLNEAKIDSKKLIKINAGDPVEICSKILNIYDEYKGLSNICLVPLGTKPHAIGAGLSALIKNDITIMYQVPRSYSMNSTRAGKKMWIYKIF